MVSQRTVVTGLVAASSVDGRKMLKFINSLFPGCNQNTVINTEMQTKKTKWLSVKKKFNIQTDPKIVACLKKGWKTKSLEAQEKLKKLLELQDLNDQKQEIGTLTYEVTNCVQTASAVVTAAMKEQAPDVLADLLKAELKKEAKNWIVHVAFPIVMPLIQSAIAALAVFVGSFCPPLGLFLGFLLTLGEFTVVINNPFLKWVLQKVCEQGRKHLKSLAVKTENSTLATNAIVNIVRNVIQEKLAEYQRRWEYEEMVNAEKVKKENELAKAELTKMVQNLLESSKVECNDLMAVYTQEKKLSAGAEKLTEEFQKIMNREGKLESQQDAVDRICKYEQNLKNKFLYTLIQNIGSNKAVKPTEEEDKDFAEKHCENYKLSYFIYTRSVLKDENERKTLRKAVCDRGEEEFLGKQKSSNWVLGLTAYKSRKTQMKFGRRRFI